MTVTAIRLENFMAFEDTGWIELKPITLLFGRNSSGKSAIIRALRLLQQSLDKAPIGTPFALNYDYGVDVGSFSTIIHGTQRAISQNRSSFIGFGFRFTVDDKYVSELFAEEQIFQPWIELNLKFGIFDGKIILVSVECNAWKTAIPEKDRRTIFAAERSLWDFTSNQNQWWFWSDFLEEHLSEEETIWKYLEIGLQNGFLPFLQQPQPDQEQASFFDFRQASENKDYILVVNLLKCAREDIGNFLRAIQHIEPIRPTPQRRFILDASSQRQMQMHDLDDYLRLLKDEITPQERYVLNKWLSEFELGAGVSPKPVLIEAGGLVISSLELEEAEGGMSSINLVDTGFGASQIIPILSECISAQPNSWIIIEQPELHLHPRAQSHLADLFCSVTQYGNLLVESHSEHLLLRLQTILARTASNSLPTRESSWSLITDQLAVYFIRRPKGDTESTVSRLEFNPLGDMLNTPEGFEDFFSDDTLETATRMRERLKIKQIRRGEE